MYNCNNCGNLETLYFQCKACNKELCRKCINPNKHSCNKKKNNYEYSLDMFCDHEDCLMINNLIKCKKCGKKFCNKHINHNCIKRNDCCIIC